MSTYVRQTPNLAVPPTQNTAPILEFRCLYTHDLRQKKKRWQDGLLRFHTFNKRVMVYDVPRNFIGDTHWREGEVVQDGDELQLEKGVMIQVGEAVGSMVQDLTALLERKIPARDGSTTHDPPPRTTYVSTARTAEAPLTQLRPKSLNALLGTPRGVYGKATLPSKSPYQERHLGDRQCQDGSHPTKRRKIEGRIGHRHSIPTETQNDNNRSHSSGITMPPLSPAPPLRKHVNTEAICIESEDENTRSFTWQRTDMRAYQDVKLGVPRSDPASLAHASHVSTSNSIQQGLFSSSTIPKAKHASGFECRLSTTTSVPPNFLKQRLTNPLRFAATKPRMKLIYKDLPQQTPFGPESDDNSASPGPRPMVKEARKRIQVAPADDVGKYHRVQREAVEARLGFRRELKISEHVEPPAPFNITSVDPLSTSNTGFQGIEQCNISAGENEASSGVRVGDKDARSKSLSKIRGHVFAKFTAFSQVTVDMNEDEGDSELSQMDQLLLSRHNPGNTKVKRLTSDTARKGALVTADCQNEAYKQLTCISHTKKPQERKPIIPSLLHPQHTPFDSEVPQKQPLQRPPPLHPTISIIPPGLPALTKYCTVPSRQRSHLKKSFSEANNTLDTVTSVKHPVRAPLQKSVSDMTGVQCSFLKGRSHKLPVEDIDVGPWSREAFDLFGRRPGETRKGKEKGWERLG